MGELLLHVLDLDRAPVVPVFKKEEKTRRFGGGGGLKGKGRYQRYQI